MKPESGMSRWSSFKGGKSSLPSNYLRKNATHINKNTAINLNLNTIQFVSVQPSMKVDNKFPVAAKSKLNLKKDFLSKNPK